MHSILKKLPHFLSLLRPPPPRLHHHLHPHPRFLRFVAAVVSIYGGRVLRLGYVSSSIHWRRTKPIFIFLGIPLGTLFHIRPHAYPTRPRPPLTSRPRLPPPPSFDIRSPTSIARLVRRFRSPLPPTVHPLHQRSRVGLGNGNLTHEVVDRHTPFGRCSLLRRRPLRLRVVIRRYAANSSQWTLRLPPTPRETGNRYKVDTLASVCLASVTVVYLYRNQSTPASAAAVSQYRMKANISTDESDDMGLRGRWGHFLGAFFHNSEYLPAHPHRVDLKLTMAQAVMIFVVVGQFSQSTEFANVVKLTSGVRSWLIITTVCDILTTFTLIIIFYQYRIQMPWEERRTDTFISKLVLNTVETGAVTITIPLIPAI
ncbi:hypothetical protein R3P38DRAFT_3230767 [Favolaschia claudopus]|uniref:Uncharacterized protein n=1 Tax=Favolaschia claudopus TaxID=2862362 RepID=A0AAV9ZLM8_9AGAR